MMLMIVAMGAVVTDHSVFMGNGAIFIRRHTQNFSVSLVIATSGQSVS